METTRDLSAPKHSGLVRMALVAIPAALLAVSAFAMGTMQGDLRPAASDPEITRWAFATVAQTAAFSVLILALATAVVESLRARRGARFKRAAVSALYILGVCAAVFVAAWLIGLHFFALPTTG